MTAFLDTNILIYAYGTGTKSNIAKELVASGGVISVQVLNEFVSVARRKLGFDWGKITNSLVDLRAVFEPIRPIKLSTHNKALLISQLHEYQIYDSLIIASALESGCEFLFTEDLHSGQNIEGLTIVNPFLSNN